MRLAPQRGVPELERSVAAPQRAMPDWDAVRLFLAVVRCGSFRAAADLLGHSINQLRRRVDDLEHQVGAKLVTRHVDGVRPTPEGEELLVIAEQMEQAAFGLLRRAGPAAKQIEGEVRVAVTEGLGTFWLVPRLVEFQRAYPRLLVDLKCAMQSADVLRMEADIAIQIKKPVSPDLKVIRLGRQYISLFAAKSYIDTYGCPKTKDELMRHRVVFLMAEQGRGQEYYDVLFPGKPQPGFVAMRTNVSSAHYWSIAKGVGIGWLPTYAAALGGQIVPLNIDLNFPFDIWLTYHPDAARIPRVRKMIDWLVEAFDSRRYPWFRDEYIHPNELMDKYAGEPLANMFAGFRGIGT